MSDTVIRVENVSKQYYIGTKQANSTGLREVLNDALMSPFRRTRQAIISGTTQRTETLWALRDISFEIKHGEILGIVGRNGSGKSTLLKILSRITEPTTGRAYVLGRLSALLEVGTGFHMDLTGRENVYLNGAILGMHKAEIDRKFEAIVEFSGISKFIDTPVKRYSSGMYVRLAFAVAANLDPDILIVDEVLAVGDAAFQAKSLGKIGEATRTGRTVLFVSHNMAALTNLCTRCIFLEAGQMVMDSTPQEAIGAYLQTNFAEQATNSLSPDVPRTGTGEAQFTRFYLEDATGTPLSVIQSGQDVTFAFEYQGRDDIPLHLVSVGFRFSSDVGQTLFEIYNDYTNQIFDTIPSRGVLKCNIPHFPFSPGKFTVHGRLVANGAEADKPRDPIGRVTVTDGDFFGTGRTGNAAVPFLLHGSWSLQPEYQPVASESAS